MTAIARKPSMSGLYFVDADSVGWRLAGALDRGVIV